MNHTPMHSPGGHSLRVTSTRLQPQAPCPAGGRPPAQSLRGDILAVGRLTEWFPRPSSPSSSSFLIYCPPLSFLPHPPPPFRPSW